MMKWIVSFIDENREQWEKDKKTRKRDMEDQEEIENWKTLTIEEKMQQLSMEGEDKNKNMITPEEKKRLRLEEYKLRSMNWRPRRDGEQKYCSDSEEGELEEQDQESDNDQEEQELGLGEAGELCIVHAVCSSPLPMLTNPP